MIKIRKAAIVSLAALLFSGFSYAQEATETTEEFPARNHVIIAFDESGTDAWRGSDQSVRTYVEGLLFDNNGSPLLGKNDYLSVVGIKADCNATFWNNFVYVKNAQNTRLAFCNNIELAQTIISNPSKWAALASYSGAPITNSYSLLSVANPYILTKLGEESDKPLVDKTYIVFITDDRFNGDDYYRELQYFLGKPEFKNKGINIHTVLKQCYKVQEEYRIIYEKALDQKTWGILHNVELFRVEPNQENLAIPAVVSTSPVIKAVRARGNSYKVNLDLKHINNHFDVKNLKVSLLSDKDTTLRKSFEDLEDESLTLTFKRKERVKAVRLDARLKLNDGFYDATLLTPETVDGLEQDIPINYEKDARFFFGIFRMPDFLWLPGIKSQATAAVLLDFIIVVIAIIALIVYLLRTNTYVPKSSDVSIRNYE